jgi:beta-lactamase superfamily II metal-dependent hydrolase
MDRRDCREVRGGDTREIAVERRATRPSVAGRAVRVAVRSSVLMVLLVGLLAPGCSRKSSLPTGPDTPPVDPTDSTIVVLGNVVTWRTSVPRLGSVRYSYSLGGFDHMAYPVALDRRDKELRQRHEVPLLDLQPGRMLYFQVVNDSANVRTFAPLDSVEVLDSLGRSLLTSTMINIGFGDSHLLTMPNGKRFLIDGGYQPAETSVAQYFAEHGVSSVDAMLATHVHLDHMGGIGGYSSSDLNALIRLASPQVFFDSPEKSAYRSIYATVLAHIAATSTPRVVLERGDTSETVPELDLDPAVDIIVLNSGRLPAPPYGQFEGDQINNDSMVLRFSYLDVDFIIGGDAEVEAEASMLAAFSGQIELEVEYYKAQHHGLSDASSPSWVRALNPRVSFIPNSDRVWDGNFEGAIASTTTKLRDVGAHVYIVDEAEALGVQRGDKLYNVTFATDGLSYEVRIEWAKQVFPNKLSAEALECMMGGHQDPGDAVTPVPEEQP